MVADLSDASKPMSAGTTTLHAPNGRKIDIPTGLFINNEWVEALDGRTIDSINPATEETICSVGAASEADVDRAVRAARAALSGPWKKKDATTRGSMLLRLADLIESEQETIATIESMDSGKPLYKAMTDIKEVFDVFRFYGGFADKNYGQTIDAGKHRFTYTIREPLGVCGGIIPWNYPLIVAAFKLAPALACGNTCVLKPSEFTPLSILYIMKFFIQLGFPPGVVNVVNGFGKEAGAAIARHPDVDKISFTGSTVTGRQIMKLASGTMKSVTLETGGKSPLIVFDDADLLNAVKWTHYGVYANAGQICTSTARIYIHENIYDKFVKMFLEYTQKNARVGDPFSKSSWVGPVASKAQFDRILSYIQVAKDDGATLIRGGRIAPDRPDDKGYFIEPTVFADATPSMRISREEIFGPFAVFAKFSSQEEVVRLANDTEYGLSAALFTKDITRAIRVSEELQAGTVWINSSNTSDPRIPFGGFKQSGIGHENGQIGLESYSTLKAVYVNLEMATE